MSELFFSIFMKPSYLSKLRNVIFTSVSFLGFILEKGQFCTDPKKVQAVAEWPVPHDRKQLQRFLGLANFYRRFFKDYSRVAAPPTQLTSTLKTFIWTPEADRAFGELKA